MGSPWASSAGDPPLAPSRIFLMLRLASGALPAPWPSAERTIPVGVLVQLTRADFYFWGPLMAGALCGSVPVALIYSFFVDQYAAGLTAGAVKG